MSSEANQAAVDKYFKVGTWFKYFLAVLIVLAIILILSGSYGFGGALLAPLGAFLLLFHSLWGKRLSKNPELKSLIADRRKKDFWAL